MIPANITSEQVQVFLLLFVRVLAMVSLLPFLGSQSVPVQLKAGFSFMIAIILYPNVPVLAAQELVLNIPTFVFMVVKEIFVGITIGFATTLLFSAVQFAGRLVDTQMGFALVQIVDPFSNTEATVTGQFQILIYSIIFLLVNGHYFLLLAVQKSFELIPLFGAQIPGSDVAGYLASMVANIFLLAVRLAAPVFAVLVLTSLSLGIVARTVPQINVFFVGLPLKIGLGVVTLAIVLPGLAILFRSMVENLITDIWRLLYLLA